MIIAFTAKGDTWDSAIDPRFGRAEYFTIFIEERNELKAIDNSDISQEAHGAGPKAAQKLHESGVGVLITGNGPGGNALSVLEKAKIDIYAGAGNMTLRKAYKAFLNHELTKL
jgi:predicted Fe-Mo cluster-binding NifX family protein